MVQRRLVIFFAQHARVVNLVSGFLLVGIGLFDFINNWPNMIVYWRLLGQ
jgi:hypothetical protein